MDILKAAIDLLSQKKEDPKPKKLPAKYAPVSLRKYNKSMDTSAKSDNTKVVRQPIMSVKQANALKAERDAAELARREKAIATSYAARNKPFSTKQLAEETGAIGDKLRLFPNDPNSFVDEYLNPGVMIGNMASGIGSLPEDVKKGRIGKAALSVLSPVVLGALGGLGGAKTKTQFLNEVLNPVAGSGELISKLGGKKTASFIEKLKALKEYSPFYVEPEVKAIKNLHKGWVERFSTPEAKRRLVEGMGIDPALITEKQKPILTAYKSKHGSFQAVDAGSHQGLIDYLKRGNARMINYDMDTEAARRDLYKYWTSPKGIYEHEIGHDLQTLAYLSSPEYKQIVNNFEKQKLEYDAYKKLSRSEKKLIPNPPTKPDKYSIMLPISKDTRHYRLNTPVDELANKLDLKEDSDLSFSSSRNKDYFERGNLGDNVEKVAHLREMRQNMIDAGILKNEYDPVTPEMVKKFMDNVPDRVSTFTKNNRKNRKLLAEIFNKLPATGAGVATTLSLANQKNNK